MAETGSAQDYQRSLVFIAELCAETLDEHHDWAVRLNNLEQVERLLTHAATLHATLEEREAEVVHLRADLALLKDAHYLQQHNPRVDALEVEVTTLREAQARLTEENEKLLKELAWAVKAQSADRASCLANYEQVKALTRERDEAQHDAKYWHTQLCEATDDLQKAERQIAAVRGYCERPRENALPDVPLGSFETGLFKGDELCKRHILALLSAPATNPITQEGKFTDNGGFAWGPTLPPAIGSTRETPTNSEIILRRLLFASHPCDGRYGDDGELQCNRYPHIDFKRDSPEDIERKCHEHTLLRMADAQSVPPTWRARDEERTK